jgi:hypothetical protein
MRYIATHTALPQTHVEHIGVRRRDSKSTDRRSLKEAIGDILPVETTIGRLPDTSSSRAEIKYLRMDWITRHRH